MKIYLTILLTILLVFACNTSDPNSKETKCSSNADCTDTAKPVCDDNGACVAQTTALFINEIMASNATYLDDLGNDSDWVEIYNDSDADIDLAGYYLCDNHYDADGIDSCTKVPDTDSAKTTIKSKGFLVFYFDGNVENGVLHIGQKLAGSGDKVYLISPDETIIDSKEYLDTDGLSVGDTSFGLSTDGGDTWVLFGDSLDYAPTPMAANGSIANTPVCTADDTTACLENTSKCLVDETDAMNNKCVECLIDDDCTDGTCNENNTCDANPEIKLFINEIMASNKSYTDFTDSDWVEIYNDSDIAVDLAGYYLCDDHYDTDGISTCTQVPDTDSASTTVASKGFIVFYFNKDNLGGVLNVAQKLGGSGDKVYLISPDETIIDSKEYLDTDGLSVGDTSFGLSTDGGDTWEKFAKGESKEPTPGATNVQ